MNAGLYNAASSMVVRLAEVDMLAHNLANSATPGFRAVRNSVRSFGEAFRAAAEQEPTNPAATLPLGVTVDRERVDVTPGAIHSTGTPLDLAIDGEAFFSVRTTEGVRYTRKGNFGLDASGVLVTSGGAPVLDAAGAPLVVGNGAAVTVAETGEVVVDGQTAGRLALFEFADAAAMRSAGDGCYVGTNPQPSARARVRQGYLEESNVKPITEMVSLIEALRNYEAAARAMRATEDATQALREASQA